MNLLPEGTTWLDLLTLCIAVVGLGLAFWRYRRESKVDVRVEVGVVPQSDGGTIAVVMTNIGRRPVTIERAGFTTRKSVDGKVFERWFEINHRSSGSGLPLSDPALPRTIDAGGPPIGVLGSARSAKAAFHPDVPKWAFCVDIYRKVYWAEIPEEVQAAVKATKRRVIGPDDDYGHPTAIEVDDDVEVAPSALYD